MRSTLDSNRGLPGTSRTQSQAAAALRISNAPRLTASVRSPCPAKCPVLLSNANCQNCGVEDAEQERNLPESEHQWKRSYLADDDDVVGMIEEMIGTARHQACAGTDDDAGGPAAAERR